MLAIIGNIRINNITRLQHFKDSFNSFNSISDNWVINIRGIFREDALNFLREKLGNKLTEYSLLDDSRGWAKNSLEMVRNTKYDYILVWNEDHLNLAPQELYKELIAEMSSDNVDSMYYSWWCDGKIRSGFENLNLKKLKNIDTIELTRDVWEKACSQGHSNYLVSMVSIFKKEYLIKLLTADAKKMPGFVTALINKTILSLYKLASLIRGNKNYIINDKYFNFINKNLFNYRLTNFPKETPFDFEKNNSRVDLLPIKIALPRQELFASIDYDAFPKYSLLSRGMYHESTHVNNSIKENAKSIILEIETVLSKIDEVQVDIFVQKILKAQKIILAGAGRVGLAAKGFTMRLGHLGLNSFMLGDTSVPSVKEHDLFIVCSGSGETQTIYDLLLMAKKNQSKTFLITGNSESRMAKIADDMAIIRAPSKVKSVDGFNSIQPMTTLNEQCLGIFFDAVILKLMGIMSETHDTMWNRHSNLE